jgi:hypothetical protein
MLQLSIGDTAAGVSKHNHQPRIHVQCASYQQKSSYGFELHLDSVATIEE